jgi:ABC-type iron transport system FetAB permease component
LSKRTLNGIEMGEGKNRMHLAASTRSGNIRQQKQRVSLSVCFGAAFSRSLRTWIKELERVSAVVYGIHMHECGMEGVGRRKERSIQ